MEELFEIFYAAANEEKAKKMVTYMKDNFPFIGIPSPERAKLSKDFLKQRKKDVQVDWDFVFKCYEMPEREFHYLAIDYLFVLKNRLLKEDLNAPMTEVTGFWKHPVTQV